MCFNFINDCYIENDKVVYSFFGWSITKTDAMRFVDMKIIRRR